MGGLKRIAKMYGGIVVNGINHVYDYKNDVCVPEWEMPLGSERHAESERVKWNQPIKPGKIKVKHESTGDSYEPF